MAESHVVSGLISKRAELAGMIDHYRKEMDRISGDLRHLDATIKLFSPEFDLRTAPVKTVRTRQQMFRPGECQRMTLDVMRKANEPVSSRHIALEVIQRKGMESSTKLIEQVQKVVIGSINTLVLRKIIVKSDVMDGSGRTWRIA